MPSDPFEEYERIKGETKPIPRTIGGKKFSFPGACTADIGMEFMDAMVRMPDADVGFLALRYFAKLIGDKDMERLASVTSFPELTALAIGFFRHYGFLAKPGDESPNPRGRASRRKSSRGSARSGQASDASTTSTSPVTSAS